MEEGSSLTLEKILNSLEGELKKKISEFFKKGVCVFNIQDIIEEFEKLKREAKFEIIALVYQKETGKINKIIYGEAKFKNTYQMEFKGLDLIQKKRIEKEFAISRFNCYFLKNHKI